jgi:hypothetical protein
MRCLSDVRPYTLITAGRETTSAQSGMRSTITKKKCPSRRDKSRRLPVGRSCKRCLPASTTFRYSVWLRHKICPKRLRTLNDPERGNRTHHPSDTPNSRSIYKWSYCFLILHANNAIIAVTKLHASRSQQNHTTLQHKQRSPGEWQQLRTRSVAKLTTLYWCLRAAR